MSRHPDRDSPQPGTHEIVAAAADSPRLDLFVAGHFDISRTRAATLIALGTVTVNRKAERASYRVQGGDVLHVVIPSPETRDILPEDIPLSIVFEDESIVVVNKPAGMVVHPAPGNWTGTLVNALRGRVDKLSELGGEERAGLVHRLDKDTSGLLIVAKAERAHRILSAAIAARKVARRYAAVSWGHLKTDHLFVDKPIGRDPADRKRMAVVVGGREARTDFFRLGRFDSCELLRAHLSSGRTHQIRVHLSSIGHPVVGDDMYGGGGGRRLALLPSRRHFLHAAWLMFTHPITGERMDMRAPLPDDLSRSLIHLSGVSELTLHTDLLEYFGFYRTDG